MSKLIYTDRFSKFFHSKFVIMIPKDPTTLHSSTDKRTHEPRTIMTM